MIIINDMFLPLDFDFCGLKAAAAKELKINESRIVNAELYRKAVDARKKESVHFCCAVTVTLEGGEEKAVKNSKKASIFCERKYEFPVCSRTLARPVVIGFGPAGMFAALTLARAGLRPLVFERGEDAAAREKSVALFMDGGRLNTESNVQFGEGGAGTFSDGKLNTGIKDIRCRAVLREFVRFGADESILINSKPHIGTDRLIKIVQNLRNEIISLGGEVNFSSRFTGFEAENGKITGVWILKDGKEKLFECESAVLAIGHSARDTFEYLKGKDILLVRKPFSVGARIEHLRADIDGAMYGDFAGHPALGAADYKLAVHLEDGRGVYTFCMCPGGEVINASSEDGCIAVNGMSRSARDGINSNSAVLTDVLPEDLAGDDVLSGMYLQRDIERRAFSLSGKLVPAQTVGSLLYGKENKASAVVPTVKPGTVYASLYDVLPKIYAERIANGIKQFGKKIKGFDSSGAVLTFPETRSSSPVRIVRNESGVSPSLSGLYPCGEGAGYAGGIMSAAVDGIRTAEHIIKGV